MKGKILGAITREQAEKLLADWANLRDFRDETLDWLFHRHENVFAPLAWPRNEVDPVLNGYEVARLQGHLRKAWKATNRRERDWYIFQLRSKFNEWSRALSLKDNEIASRRVDWYEEVPEVTPLEATMFYFQTALATKARYCGGGAECPAPYFIASDARSRHCSAQCAAAATKEAKRKWWTENRAKNGGIK